jgi:ADP-heptose:LPS heptosyltransferase
MQTENIVSSVTKKTKVLVIRFSSIGDIVLTSPAIRCLYNQLPNSEIHFVTKEIYKSVSINNPYISKFFYLSSNLDHLINQLLDEDYDYIIDLHKNYRSLKIKTALKTKYLSFNKLSIQKFILTKLGINLMPKIHISKRCIDALVPLNIVDDGKGLDYFIAPSDLINNNDLPAAHSLGFVAIVIGGSYFTKKLPIKKLQELCNAINFPIVLLGGKDDVIAGKEVASIDDVKIYNACGKFSLNESADIVSKSKLVISHDTGLLYIACALRKKTIAIWGGTSPKLDVSPYYGSDTTLTVPHKNFIVPKISCQPCSNYGTKTCPKKHFKCMQQQDIAAIAATAQTMLA